MKDNKIQIALLGLGTVGTGVYRVLKKQQPEMLPKLGAEVEFSRVLVRNLERAASKVDDPSILTNKWEDIISDDTIDIVVEVMGGMEPARTYILDALHAGKNVVTANKDLIATDGHVLMDAAKEANKEFLFEWEATIASRTTSEIGCPYLSGKKVYNQKQKTPTDSLNQW